jgi:hypothetical protein
MAKMVETMQGVIAGKSLEQCVKIMKGRQ